VTEYASVGGIQDVNDIYDIARSAHPDWNIPPRPVLECIDSPFNTFFASPVFNHTIDHYLGWVEVVTEQVIVYAGPALTLTMHRLTVLMFAGQGGPLSAQRICRR
jgi:hypothetical protein